MTTRIDQEARAEADRHEYLEGYARREFVKGYVAGATRAESPVTEPTPVRIYSRGSGKTQAMIDALLAQANKLGISVEIIRPEPPVTDAWPAHWTQDDILSDLHARYHDEAGNMLGRDGCGWAVCLFWDVAKFVLEAARATREEHRDA